MNFKKLQAMQLELDSSILSAKPKMSAEERFNKTLVALSVEVAEVANCAEHFKFWKEGKGKVDGKNFFRDEDEYYLLSDITNDAYGETYLGEELTKKQVHHLTLLEECSDCLHFILSLANQLDIEISQLLIEIGGQITTVEGEYKSLQGLINFYEITNKEAWYRATIENYFCYISNLGITTTELEQAYYEKNEENYRRLREGY